jgi:hypothetical protein
MTFYSPSSFEPGFRLRDGAAANLEEGNPKVTAESALQATGTTVADAAALRATINVVVSTPLNSGLLLPQAVPGVIVYVFNRGASPVRVYGQGTNLVDGVASVVLTNALNCGYYCVSPGVWFSAQLGAASA